VTLAARRRPLADPAQETFPMSFSKSVRTRAGLFFVSAGALLWGTTGVAVRIVADRTGLSAVTIGWYRVAIATAVIAVAFRAPGLRRARAAFARHPARLVLCGVGFGGYQALYFVGVQYVGVSVSTLVSLAVAPVALTGGAALARRRRPAPFQLGVLVLAVGGLALVSLRPGSGAAAPHPVWGVLASIASGLGYAGITALSGRMAGEDPLVLTGVTSAVGALVLLPFALAAGVDVPHDTVAGGWLVYIGVVPTVLAYWLFYAGLRSTHSEVAGVLTLLEPLTAAGVAALVLHESLSPAAVAGGGLLLAAIAALYLRPPGPELTEVPPP
jgi:DME family drug/metabolite transporter